MNNSERMLPAGFLLDGQYKISFFLGKDGGCEKYRALTPAGKPCLLKIFDISKLDPECLHSNLPLEIYLTKQINHPRIVSYIADGNFIFNGNKFLYLATEYPVGNTLCTFLNNTPLTTYYDIKAILRDILSALEYLHTLPQPVIYNNISDQTIIIDQHEGEFHAQLTDLSAARFFLQDAPTKILSTDFRYIPDETLMANIISKHTDLFGAGVILYQMISDSLPWHMENCSRQDLEAILRRRKSNKLEIPDLKIKLADYENGLETIIKRALSTNPNEYFNSAKDLLETLESGKTSSVPLSTAHIYPPAAPLSTLPSGKRGFAAIAGMSSLKQLLQRDVLDILKNPEEYKKHHLGLPNGMILYGPPGCGKTFFAERFAEEAGYNFIKVVASDLASIYVHGTQQKIGQLFKEAREQAPAILYFDELDAMVPDRETDFQQQRGEVNEFLSQLDNIGNSGIFVIGSTNKPHLIDKAVLRAGRLEKHIYIPPPDFDARKELFHLYLENRPLDLGINYDTLARLTEHYVSADIKFLVDEASRSVISKKLKRITMLILEDIISSIKPSITSDLEQNYKNFEETGKYSAKRIGFLNN